MSDLILQDGCAYLKVKTRENGSFTPTLTLRQANGDLVDLTGYSAKWQVREDEDSSLPIVDADSSASQHPRLVLGGALGTIVFDVQPADWGDIPSGTWVHGLVLTAPSGKKWPIFEGPIQVSRGVCR